jgi:hypothetical protein
VLREANDDLWPASARGRSKPRHVLLHHLGNLAIALAVTQMDTTEVGPDRVRAFRMLAQTDGDGARPGLTFGEALDELIDIAARDTAFRGAVWTSPGPVIQLAPTQMALAEVSGGPGGGRYRSTDMNGLQVATMMHVRSMGITSIGLIDGSVIKTLAELYADSQAAHAVLESERTAPGRTAPSRTSLRSDTPDGTPTTQTSGLDNHNSSACVRVPSREPDRE